LVSHLKLLICGYYPSPRLVFSSQYETHSKITSFCFRAFPVPAYIFDIFDRTSGQLLSSTLTSSSHGKIIIEWYIGWNEWNKQENKVVYIAEPLAQTSKGWLWR